MSNFRQLTPPLNTHRNSPPRNLMHRASPVTGISAMPPPSTRLTKRALLHVRPALCKSAIFGDDPRQGHGVVHADVNDGLGRELHLFPFARQNVGGAPNQPYAETASHVAEDSADQSASAGSNGPGKDIALDVVLGFDHLALINPNVLPGLPRFVSRCRGLQVQDAHFQREYAAVDLEVAERK